MSAGTNTSSKSRFFETVPRIPSGSQSPSIVMPAASAGTPRNRTTSSPSTMQVTLCRSAASDSEAKILRPETRKPPSTGTARVAKPVVSPGARPSLNGCAWMWPSSTTPRHMAVRRRSWVTRSSSDMDRSSAIWPVRSMVAVCMLKVNAVEPQCRPSSSETRA